MIDVKTRTDDAIAVNPFTALRTAFGMLLGVDDFNVLMGNPRGKGMIHNAWLHGVGVVCGFDVEIDRDNRLRIHPGLAIDPIGRELVLDGPCCVDLDAWIEEQRKTEHWAGALQALDDGRHRVCVCLVARFETCLARPLPTLVDPCDPDRSGTDSSRVVETTRFELQLGHCEPNCECDPPDFRRLRCWFGLRDDDPDVSVGRRGRDSSSHDDSGCRRTRHLAATDAADRLPIAGSADPCAKWFNRDDNDPLVVVAELCLDLRQSNHGYEICAHRIDRSSAETLLPTSAIQQIMFEIAAKVDAVAGIDAGGPRVIPDSLRWRSETCVEFEVTSSLLEGTIATGIRVTSLSGQVWREHDFTSRYSNQSSTVTIDLDTPIRPLTWRIVVRGSGPNPVVGDNFVPLAGVVGGPPCTIEGHDAVLTNVRSAS